MKVNNQILIGLGRKVRNFRKTKKLSQEKLAYNAGLDRSFVGAIERGERNPTVLTIFRLAKVLDVHPMQFFEDIENDE